MQFVAFPLSDGGQVMVGVDQLDEGWSGVVTRGGSVEERFHEAACSFEAALEPIRAVGQGVLDRLTELERPPSEVRVEFGVEISAKAGAIVSASGTATLKVTLVWRTPEPCPDPAPTGAGGP